MRFTTILRRLLDVSRTVVRDVRFEGDDLVLKVAPTWRRSRCGSCGKVCPGYDHPPTTRRWRDLAFGSTVFWLEYDDLRRVNCPDCGVRVEMVPWAAHRSRFTLRFEELAAFLAQVCDRTTAAALLGTSWRAVGAIIERVVSQKLDPRRLDNVKRIAIDEFSYRKRHRYITVIVDHDTGKVIWAAPGRGSETLAAFFAELGPERTATLTTATIDMAGGYIKALKEHAPHVQIIFDRFHVQKLAHDALDQVRREVWRLMQAGGEQDNKRAANAVKGSRFSLHRRSANQTLIDVLKLRDVRKLNAPLYRAWQLKETLAEVLDRRQPNVATRLLRDWLAWASRSRLAPFKRVGRTIRRHLDGVLAYFRERLTNGIAEGTNNRLRAIARRAFGFHSAKALIAMAFLCCGGIVLDPPLPRFTH